MFGNISRRRFRGALRAVSLNRKRIHTINLPRSLFSLHSNVQGCQTASNASSQVATSEEEARDSGMDARFCLCRCVASVKILFPGSDHLPGRAFLLRLNLYRLCVVAASAPKRRMEERESLNNDEVEFSALIKIE